MDFKKELETLINRCSRENGSDTPDFILADYMNECLLAFERATNKRTKWFSKEHVVHVSEKSVTARKASE